MKVNLATELKQSSCRQLGYLNIRYNQKVLIKLFSNFINKIFCDIGFYLQAIARLNSVTCEAAVFCLSYFSIDNYNI